MTLKAFKSSCVFLIALFAGSASMGQNVPLGISYQAVARDNYGKELVNKSIDVKFSIISGNPLGTVVYQELHAKQITSKFGVFSLVIGTGTPTGGTFGELSQIQWGTAPHYLRVEVKFDNDFVDMGTMPFLSVPYALYAQKSLEAGPKGDPGPKGDQGDPATDNQSLSFNGVNLSISGGNTVNLSSLNIPHQLTLLGDTLSILGGNKVGLTNQIQDLQLDINSKLKITKNASATAIDLSKFTQALSFNQDNYQLSLSNGGGTASLGQIIAFRAGIASTVNLPNNTPVNIVFNQVTGVYYTDGIYYNSSSGSFTAPFNGIYSFSVFINLPIGSSVIINLFGDPYETIIGPTNSIGSFRGTLTMKLNKGDEVNASVLQSNGYTIPFSFAGSFSGYKVY
jgi:hypothetical protein